MAEEIGALRAVLALESAAFDRGVQSARRQLGVLEGGLSRTGTQVAAFGQRMSRDASGGFRALESGASGARAGLQNFGFQVQDVAVQIAAGTDATRALSMQLPQLLSGFGLMGVAIGTAVAVLGPLVSLMFEGADATASWTDELSLTSGSISGVTSATTALEGVQRQYVEAIEAQGGASSAAAALVISNSAREFEARKQLLGVELELLRIRGQEQAQARANISDQIRLQAEARARSVDPGQIGLGGTDRAGGTIGDYVNIRPRNLDEMGLGGDFAQRDILAVQKLNAELELTNLTIERTDALMNTTFDSIAGGGGSVGSGGGGGGGGGRRGGGAPRAAGEIANVTAATNEVSQAAKQMQTTLGGAFVDLVTGAKSFGDALSEVANQLARMLAQSAFDGFSGRVGDLFDLFTGGDLFANIAGNANGNAFTNGRVSAFAKGGIVTGPTLFPMANGAGLMGEAGPEAIMPLTRVGGKLGVMASGGGGGTVINVDARYASEGTAEMIVRALQAAAPGIVQQSVGAMRSATARGR